MSKTEIFREKWYVTECRVLDSFHWVGFISILHTDSSTQVIINLERNYIQPDRNAQHTDHGKFGLTLDIPIGLVRDIQYIYTMDNI